MSGGEQTANRTVPIAEPMKVYRLYHLDKNGKILSPETFEAEDDLRAIRRARQTESSFGVELWQEARKIGTY